MLLKKRIFFVYFFLVGILATFSLSDVGKTVFSESKKEIGSNDKFLDNIKSSCLDFHQDDKIFEKLYIEIPSSKSWSKNIFRAFTAKSKEIILQRYKKRYSGYVNFSKNEDFCSFKSRIRLTGARKDHIKILDNKIISSLDINLKEGNINGITKFKLFLPETRNYDSEILTTYLIRELGFISPRTAYIDLEINDHTNKMIIQEKAAKELIEFNKLRESALLTTNNELLYSLQSKGNRLFDPYNSTIFPKLINHKWALKSKENHKISFNAMHKFSDVFQKSWSQDWDEHISFSDYSLSNGNQKTRNQLLEFRALLIAMGAEHGLINNNRKFYFDPLTESFLPIYYDGDSKINDNYILDKNKIQEIEKDLKFVFNELNEYNIKSLIEKIKKLDIDLVRNELSKLNLKIDKSDIANIQINLLQNLEFLAKNLKEREERNYLNGPHFYYKDLPERFGIVFSGDNRDFLFCDIKKNNCCNKNLDESESIELISSNQKYDDIKYFFAGRNFRKYLIGKSAAVQNKLNLFKDDIIAFYYLGNPAIKLDKTRKFINIETYNEKDKIIFLNSYLNDFSIKINSPTATNTTLQRRNDENLLTGMLTIKDSRFNNLNIEINGGVHEDALNIINSIGTINQLVISNSFQDAIDFDFSDIKINNILVKNAGNDCIDFSGGKYIVNSFIASNCFDKGISVGESSNAIFEKINIKNIGMGFVSKDSSILNIKKGIIEDYKICAAGYRKKQEFNGSIIYTKQGICPEEKIEIQKKSYYFEK